MFDDDKQRFHSHEGDEEIDHFLTADDTEDDRNFDGNLTQELRRYYSSGNDQSVSLERVWHRLQQYRASSGSVQDQVSSQSHMESQHASFMHRERSNQMNKVRQHSQYQNVPPGRFTMIAAVVFLMLLVGSAVAIFQFAREGHSGTGLNRTANCTATSLATPAGDLPDVYALVNNTLYRFSPTSHKILWQFHMLPKDGSTYTGFPGQVVNGTYYQLGTNTDGYYLYALNTANGRIRWRMKLGSADNIAINSPENLVISGGPVIAEGRVYVSEASIAGGYSEIIARDAATGNEIWQHRYTDTGTENGAKHNTDFATGLQLQTAANGMLYANDFMRQHGTSTLTLSAISTADGSIKWQTTTKTSAMVVGEQAVDGTLYLSTILSSSANRASGQILTYDAATGSLQWTSQPFVGSPSPPIIGNGIAYIGTINDINGSGGSVYAFQASSGTQIWHYTAQAGVSTPAVADGIVYIGASPNYGGHHTITALDGMTGATCWSHSTEASIVSPLAVSKSFMYLSTSTTSLVALRLSDGSQVDTYTIGGTSNPAGPDSNMVLTIAPSS